MAGVQHVTLAQPQKLKHTSLYLFKFGNTMCSSLNSISNLYSRGIVIDVRSVVGALSFLNFVDNFFRQEALCKPWEREAVGYKYGGLFYAA
jgi:hypothetical protein